MIRAAAPAQIRFRNTVKKHREQRRASSVHRDPQPLKGGRRRIVEFRPAAGFASRRVREIGRRVGCRFSEPLDSCGAIDRGRALTELAKITARSSK